MKINDNNKTDKKVSVSIDLEIKSDIVTYDCDLSTCPNPQCECNMLCLHLTRVDKENGEKESHTLSLDVVKGKLDTDDTSVNEGSFSENFIQQLDDKNLKKLFSLYYFIKSNIAENAPLSDFIMDFSEAEYDYDEVDLGLSVSYEYIFYYKNVFYVQ